MDTTRKDSLASFWNGLSLKSSEVIYIYMSVIIAATILWLAWTSASSYFRTRARGQLPPGSFGFPIIGDTVQFVLAIGSDVGYRKWLQKKIAKYGPVFKWSFQGMPVVVMDPPGGHKFLFQNEGKLLETYSPVQMVSLWGDDSIVLQLGERHKLLRRHLSRFFDHASISRYLEGVNRNVVQHFSRHWADKEESEFELVPFDVISLYTFSDICNLLMSLDEGPELESFLKEFLKWQNGLLCLPINLPGFTYYKALKARKSILRILGEYVKQRKREVAEGRVSERAKLDILTNLLTVPNENGNLLSDSSIYDNLLMLLVAGFSTTSSALAMTIFYIGKNPEVYEQLVKEHKSILDRKREEGKDDVLIMDDLSAMRYTWQVIQETLRLQPPVGALFRRTTMDCEYKGYAIPKDWKLMCNIVNSHYDLNCFNEPMTFNPSRWEQPPIPFTFMPFGGGQRTCLGIEFAKMQMLVFIHHLVRRCRWSVTDPNETIIRDPVPRTQKTIKITSVAMSA
ncbi:hypothetical protein R1sor_003969 [Riccia sorocarpa]|uniref:Cytochrome P450 n=1 Tax=Riccia sorocarpa TaxID=122646 RepID=A0ABD3H5Z2_9MARC